LEDRLSYTPSDCFETFPFSQGVLETSRGDADALRFFAAAKDAKKSGLERLEGIGREYYEFRADLMIRNNEGLTKTYNRFHDPHETSSDIKKLRELHNAMDRAVLDAYGWTDLQPPCEFLLDYEDEGEEDENGVCSQGRNRRKPWRYRWPDAFRDEVLARLLELNKERAEQERLAGLAADAAAGKTKSKKEKGKGPSKRRRKKEDPEDQPSLFARKNGQARGAGPT
jgi:hypothetical protein